MIFKPMRRKDVHEALKGQENVLSKAVEENDRFFRSLPCPTCGGKVMPIVNTRHLFREGAVLPNFLGKCEVCGCEFEPHTGIIVARAEPPGL